MRRYSTEIHIAADRHVALQLPEGLPEGRAFVVVYVPEPDAPDASPFDIDPDRQDIEWWDEFDELYVV